jgi:transposase
MHSHFVGLDVHKQTIAFCIKQADGKIINEGSIRSNRDELDQWVKGVPTPWIGGMETTMFSHWIYYHLKDRGCTVWMGHAARMKAICAGKKKSDKIDARTIADLLRCDMFPSCYVISPELGALRRQMRFRRTVVNEQTRFKNLTAGLLMQRGVEYEKRRLHGKRYFQDLMAANDWAGEEMKPLLHFNREQIEALGQMDKRLIGMLEKHPLLQQRLEALETIDGVGPVTALTWALEIGTPSRFRSIHKAQSYAGLTSAFWESAGKQKHGPISKQRNAHLQSVIIEAAKLARLHNEKLNVVYQKHRDAGADDNLATLEVARKLVAYLLAVDRAATAQAVEAGSKAKPATQPPAKGEEVA